MLPLMVRIYYARLLLLFPLLSLHWFALCSVVLHSAVVAYTNRVDNNTAAVEKCDLSSSRRLPLGPRSGCSAQHLQRLQSASRASVLPLALASARVYLWNVPLRFLLRYEPRLWRPYFFPYQKPTAEKRNERTGFEILEQIRSEGAFL